MVKKIVLFFVISMVLCAQSVVYADEKAVESKKSGYEKVTLIREELRGNVLERIYETDTGELTGNYISVPMDVMTLVESAENKELEAKKQLILIAMKFNMDKRIKELKHESAKLIDAKEFAIHPSLQEKIEREQYEAIVYAETELKKWKELDDKEREKELKELKENYSYYHDYDEGPKKEEGPEVNGVPYEVYKDFSKEAQKEMGVYDIVQEKEGKKKTTDKKTSDSKDVKEKDNQSFTWVIILFVVILLAGIAWFIRKRGVRE